MAAAVFLIDMLCAFFTFQFLSMFQKQKNFQRKRFSNPSCLFVPTAATPDLNSKTRLRPALHLQQIWGLPECLSVEFERLIELIVKDFVSYWWQTISFNTDFPSDVSFLLTDLIGAIYARVEKTSFNTIMSLVEECLQLLENHLEWFRQIDLNEEKIQESNRLHPGCRDESAYINHLVIRLLSELKPELIESSSFFTSLCQNAIREILANAVVQPLIQYLSPYYLNRWILNVLNHETTEINNSPALVEEQEQVSARRRSSSLDTEQCLDIPESIYQEKERRGGGIRKVMKRALTRRSSHFSNQSEQEFIVHQIQQASNRLIRSVEIDPAMKYSCRSNPLHQFITAIKQLLEFGLKSHASSWDYVKQYRWRTPFLTERETDDFHLPPVSSRLVQWIAITLEDGELWECFTAFQMDQDVTNDFYHLETSILGHEELMSRVLTSLLELNRIEFQFTEIAHLLGRQGTCKQSSTPPMRPLIQSVFLFEQERYLPLQGWSKSMLLSPWIDNSGQKRTRNDFPLPNVEWYWSSKWKPDSIGWVYENNQKRMRKRRWIRYQTQYDPILQASRSNQDEELVHPEPAVIAAVKRNRKPYFMGPVCLDRLEMCLFQVLDEIFEIDQVNVVRRNLFSITRRFIRFSLHGSTQRWIRTNYPKYTQPEALAELIQSLRLIFWTKQDQWITAEPDHLPCFDQEQQVREQSRIQMLQAMPVPMVSLLGEATCRNGCLKVHEFLQHELLVKNFVFSCIDIVLKKIF